MNEPMVSVHEPVTVSFRPLRILVHHRIASRDGQSVHLDELTHALKKAGHEVRLVGPAQFEKTSFGGSSGVVDKLKMTIPNHLYQLMEISYNFLAFWRVLRRIRIDRPDIIYERFSLYLLAGVIASKITRVPLMLEINSPLFEERNVAGDMGFKTLGRMCQQWLWRQSDRLLPVTEVLADEIRKYGVTLADRVHVIPNGVDTDTIHYNEEDVAAVREEFSLTGKLVIGFVGFIRSWNSVDKMLGFLDKYAKELGIHLMIVGDGPARTSLEEFAAAKNLKDHLTITGLTPRAKVPLYIGTFDIAILPGVTSYSSPLKMFEYMYLGRAIVAPATRNIEEILTHESNGLLFQDNGLTPTFNECLLALCRDSQMRRKLGANARTTILSRGLTWPNNARRVAQIASSLLVTDTNFRPAPQVTRRGNP